MYLTCNNRGGIRFTATAADARAEESTHHGGKVREVLRQGLVEELGRGLLNGTDAILIIRLTQQLIGNSWALAAHQNCERTLGETPMIQESRGH